MDQFNSHPTSNRQSHPSVLLAALLAGLTLLSACGKTDDGLTAGQRVDQAVASTEKAAEKAGDKAREVGRETQQAAGEAGDAITNKSRDMVITASVKAKLAGDPQLSAMDINVDTAGARVVLRGTAPNTAARGHATELARGVDGVVDVTNELVVKPVSN